MKFKSGIESTVHTAIVFQINNFIISLKNYQKEFKAPESLSVIFIMLMSFISNHPAIHTSNHPWNQYG
jgi:hypothetical protein